jgi:hypothetical protein
MGIGIISASEGEIFIGPPDKDKTHTIKYVGGGVGPNVSLIKNLPKKAGNIPGYMQGPSDYFSVGAVLVMPGCKSDDLEAKDFEGFCIYADISIGGGFIGGGATILYMGLPFWLANPMPTLIPIILESAKAAIPIISHTMPIQLPSAALTLGAGHSRVEENKQIEPSFGRKAFEWASGNMHHNYCKDNPEDIDNCPPSSNPYY